MRRATIALAALVVALGLAAIGCGGEQDQSATPETVTGGLPTETQPTDTGPTETQPTETGPTDTEPTDTGPTETQPTETEPAEGDPAAGREVFLGPGGCGTCHTLADAGTTGTVGPNLDDSQPAYELALDRVTNGLGGMPPFAGQLTEQQIADVAAYVSQAAGG